MPSWLLTSVELGLITVAASLANGVLGAGGAILFVPLALYAYAMPLVSMTESAVMQYVTPTVTFILALTVFHERLTTVDLTGYGLIWCGLERSARWNCWITTSVGRNA